MTAKVIMVQGTSSSAGKSLLVAGLCRLYARRGVRIAPFKAQNMSNNAGVCPDGSEIGRAQITQAFAAGIEPTPEMNPILLKPESNMQSQVVVMGRAQERLKARSYFERKQKFWGTVTSALDSLRAEYDLVIAEGAGSPVELNLKRNDIVNMAVARYAQADVFLVGDIDRGGIFAQLLGTLWLLPPEEQALVKGFIVNKFRGDPSLFEDGVKILAERSGKEVLGVIPWLEDLYLPEEDGVALDDVGRGSGGGDGSAESNTTDIVVIHLPRISNFDDFDPLLHHPGVRVRWVKNVSELGDPDAIILPGSKSSIADLEWLKERGLADEIIAKAKEGTHIVGICGGYQMLGLSIHDPDNVESVISQTNGLGLLNVRTQFAGVKSTSQTKARIRCEQGWLGQLNEQQIDGYEIHMGQTDSPEPWLTIEKRGKEAVSILCGAISTDGEVWGCYLHGLFANDNFRKVWLSHIRQTDAPLFFNQRSIMESLDRVANTIEESCPMLGKKSTDTYLLDDVS